MHESWGTKINLMKPYICIMWFSSHSLKNYLARYAHLIRRHFIPPPLEIWVCKVTALIPITFFFYYLRRMRLCFYFGLFVSLWDNWKRCERILAKFLGGIGHGSGTNQFNFGDDPGHRPEPGVRSPKSGFTGSNYQWIFMKFYGEPGCGLETNWLHFGDDPNHYMDPGVRFGSPSGSGKNCHNSIMLAFVGGLCSLSTSSFQCCYSWLSKCTNTPKIA